MPKFFMPIASAFAPNYTLKDVLIAGKYLMPWNRNRLQSGGNISELEEEFRKYLDADKAVSFASGRSGFYTTLKALGIREGDEIILQAFTTVALPNTIKLFGAKPIFVDIEPGTYNMNPEKIKEKITPKTKIILIQHTFGNPADIERIMSIAEKHGLKTIEDCAHSLGAEYNGKKTGKFADTAFFSFGRDKVISSVSGGMVIAKDYALAEKIETLRNELEFPSKKSIIKNLLHPIITFKALHTYKLFSIGKIAMFIAFKFKILDKAYSAREKKNEPEIDFAKKMPNALAAIALHQMIILDKFNRHRIKTAGRYEKGIKSGSVGLPDTKEKCKNIFLWYTIAVKDKRGFIKKAQEKDMIFGDWFPQAIGPREVDLKKSGYEKGSCPIAEDLSAHCVNLPTHHNMGKKEAKKVIEFVNNYK